MGDYCNFGAMLQVGSDFQQVMLAAERAIPASDLNRLQLPKVLLVNSPAERKIFLRDLYCVSSSKAGYVWQPVDLLVMSGRLASDFHITIRDCIGSRMNMDDLARSLERHHRFDFVLALICSVTLRSDIEFLKRVKELYPDAKIIVLGDFAREHGVKFLEENEFIDGCLLDFTADNLASALKSWDSIDPADNIVRRVDGQLVVGKLVRNGTKFSIGLPHHEKFENYRYKQPVNRKLPVAAVLGSVGCQFTCGFCSQGTIAFRARPAAEIVEELKYLKALGVKEVLFRDQLLEGNRRNFTELCRLIIEADLGLSWYGNCRADTLNEEIISLMKKAGCHSILMGIETSNDAILEQLKTRKTRAQTVDTILMIRKHGISVLGYFILGLPGETRQDILNTIDLACDLDIDLAAFTTPSPDYGTMLREDAIAQGILNRDVIANSDRSAQPIELNTNVSAADLVGLRRRAYLRFYCRPRVIMRLTKILGSHPRLLMNAFSNMYHLVLNQLNPPRFA